MDYKTVKIYDDKAQEIAERHKRLNPERLHELAKKFFVPDGKTADIGCGMGRDTQWLNDSGYPAIGYDPSEGMLKIARMTYLGLEFHNASLPDLTLPDESFENVYLCSVLMHVPEAALVKTVVNLLRVTKKNGHIVLCYRKRTDEKDERLFEEHRPEKVSILFESMGAKTLLIETDGVWYNLVFQKVS